MHSNTIGSGGAGTAAQGRDQTRTASIISNQVRTVQELDLAIEHVCDLRDKINGGQPSPDKPANQAPRAMPNGFLATLEDTQDIVSSKLQILANILQEIERNF